MKILHIGSFDSRSNGITSVVLAITKAQKVLGHKVDVLNLFPNGEKFNEFIEFKNNRFISDILNQINPDIVVIHGMFHLKIKDISKWLLRNKIPYIIEPHGAYSYNNYKKNHIKKFLFAQIFVKNALQNASSIVFLTQNEYENFALKKWITNYTIIPNGCYPVNNPLIQKRILDNKIKIVFIGRIDIIHKGLDILINSIKYLKLDKLNVHIHFDIYSEFSI